MAYENQVCGTTEELIKLGEQLVRSAREHEGGLRVTWIPDPVFAQVLKIIHRSPSIRAAIDKIKSRVKESGNSYDGNQHCDVLEPEKRESVASKLKCAPELEPA